MTRPRFGSAPTATTCGTRSRRGRRRRTVVDLGAGTGRFTELLVPTGARVDAVDAVVVAQAFHWFRHDEALAEIAGVLHRRGGLALVWNRRDESVPWVARMSEIIKWRANQVSEYDRTDWPGIIGRAGGFGPVEHRRFP